MLTVKCSNIKNQEYPFISYKHGLLCMSLRINQKDQHTCMHSNHLLVRACILQNGLGAYYRIKLFTYDAHSKMHYDTPKSLQVVLISTSRTGLSEHIYLFGRISSFVVNSTNIWKPPNTTTTRLHDDMNNMNNSIDYDLGIISADYMLIEIQISNRATQFGIICSFVEMTSWHRTAGKWMRNIYRGACVINNRKASIRWGQDIRKCYKIFRSLSIHL